MKQRANKKSSANPGVYLWPIGTFLLGVLITWLAMRTSTQPEVPGATVSLRAPAAPALSSSPEAVVVQANHLYDRKEWTQAIAAYEGAIALGADNADVRTDLGNAYRFAHQPQKALEQYAIAQRQNPNHENSLFNQAGVYAFELNQPTRALEIWRECLARFPSSSNAANIRQLIAEAETAQKRQSSEALNWLDSRAAPSPAATSR